MKMVWNTSTRSSSLALPQLHIPVDYGVFRYSASMGESFSLLQAIIYIIIILYLWHLAYREHFVLVCVEQMFLGIDAMSIWFWS
jgi:hypothetical protein